MASINWNTLRSWDGSQDSAFEELCCQLAAHESAPPGSRFTRKRAPDAGLECYWKLPNGEEWGWQAKFFTNVPDAQQWQQIDESVQTALEKHPALVLYTVCIPLDRQDPRKANEEWFMGKWNAHVTKWKQWATKTSRSVDFGYWGEHEIFARLSKSEHTGRLYFWFNKEYLSREWFNACLEKTIANAGPRYSPEINVELPISLDFDGLCRTSDFFSRLTARSAAVKKNWKSVTRNISEETKTFYSPLVNTMNHLCSLLFTLPYDGVAQLEYESMIDLCKQAGNDIWTCLDELRRLLKESEERAKESKKEKSTRELSEQHDHRYYLLNQLAQSLNELRAFAASNEALLANKPYLLLVGQAGTGKTHLFCDVAKRMNQKGLPAIVLLGEQFNDSDPWGQIIKLLGLSCRNEEELLGALEATTQMNGTRALILLDALNEGDGKKLWHKHIAGMVTTLSRFPHVGLAVSVRTSYEGTVIQDHVRARFVREVHEGFADHEYDATATFFDHYRIQRPSVPLLVPEFRNPLFLKIFCMGLQNRRMTTIPEGLDGISAVFEFFIESINEKLSSPDQLDFDVKGKFVQKVVTKLAEEMAQSEANWLKRDDARRIADSVFPAQLYTQSIFHGLISEGLLAEDIAYLGKDAKPEDVVRFAYERFGDHLVAAFLLDKYLDSANPSSSFNPGQPLGEFVKDEASAWGAQGLVEAFSVQIPERIRKEFIEIVPPAIKAFRPVQEAFLYSLLWRKAQTIGDAALEYINETIIRTQYFHDRLIDTVLTLVPKPDHPFNARFLHKNLKGKDLPNRDASWSVFLHRQYGRNGAVDRLLDWAWSQHTRDYIKDDAIYLIGIALVWFLTSSNRFIRDRATKGLVILLESRLQVLQTILQDFQEVNDPYVLERLLAVAYGCAMRSKNNAGIAELAQLIYEQVFRSSNPPPHILLRDYARGVIEVALHKGLSLKVDVKRIRPPYKSTWIPPSYSAEELHQKYYPKDWKSDRDYGDIWGSVMGGGDFERYIIGTNSHRFDWTSRILGERRKPSRKERYQKFEKSLVGGKKKALTSYVGSREVLDLYRRMGKDALPELAKYSEQDLEALVASAEKTLRKALSKPELKRLDEIVLPYLKNPYVDEFAFDLSVAQRWIFEKVIQLGWTPKLFGEFDSAIREGFRNTDKPERIGKKYQWIAYHEFLARIADNFEYRGDTWAKTRQRYVGPWQDSLRDIDPSFVLPRTENDPWGQKPCWWFSASYDWQENVDDVTWLKRSQDLPSIESLIKVRNCKDQTRWLLLEGFLSLRQPYPPDQDKYEEPRREWFFILKSYLVRRRDMKIVFEWAEKQNFIHRGMPESTEMSKVFIGEYPWAPSFQYMDIPYFGHPGWTMYGREEKIPKSILVTNDEYFWGRGYDCSIHDTVSFNLPTKLIVDRMRLHWNGFPGKYSDDTGDVAFLDPSVSERGPSVLLAKEDRLCSFLSEHGYDILWTVRAEKNMIGGSLKHEDWKGRLEISGAYRMLSGKLTGNLNTKFRSRDTDQ